MTFMIAFLTIFIGLFFIVGMKLFGVGEGWLREDPLVRPYRWLRPDLVPPSLFFLCCDPSLTPGGSGVLSDPVKNDEEFRKAWLPYFCRSGQREVSLEEFNEEVVGWLPLLPEVHLPPLTGNDLFQVVRGENCYCW